MTYMIRNGIKPLIKQPRKIFAHEFGGTLSVPDFNLDSGLWNPSQDALGMPTECTSFFIADTFTDLNKKLYYPGFSYGATMFTENIQPTIEGANPLAALQSAVIAGVLPQNSAPQRNTELEDANWASWQPFSKTTALLNVAVDVHNALGYADAFTSILSTIWTGQVTVALCTPWYAEFEQTGADGIMPMPANVNNVADLPWHCWAAKGQKTINGKPCGIGKSWQGPSFGDNGFSY